MALTVKELLATQLSPDKVKDMSTERLEEILVTRCGIVASAADLRMIIIEGVQKALDADDEFPIRFYAKDEPMPEESRVVVDPGPMLTDDYIENNLQNS